MIYFSIHGYHVKILFLFKNKNHRYQRKINGDLFIIWVLNLTMELIGRDLNKLWDCSMISQLDAKRPTDVREAYSAGRKASDRCPRSVLRILELLNIYHLFKII